MTINTAMILAAGRGERMRPLTDEIPKPLLKVGGKPLIQHHIEKLFSCGIKRIVINLHWLGEEIEAYLGDGSRFGVEIYYCYEDPVLETAGGIVNALPKLGTKPFLVVNGDIWTDFDFRALLTHEPFPLARLVLVNNPTHNANGDFHYAAGEVNSEGDNKLTFSGIAVYHPNFFDGLTPQKYPLAPLLFKYIDQKKVDAVHHTGKWCDVGTPERLKQLNEELSHEETMN